jgi:PleD family two-component response regulator
MGVTNDGDLAALTVLPASRRALDSQRRVHVRAPPPPCLNHAFKLADDHVLVLEGFRRILQEHYELVGTVGDGYAILAAAKIFQPDIVILDISMPLLNGIDTAAQLKKISVQQPRSLS